MRFLVAAALAAALSTSIYAQTGQGSVTGAVTDPSGAALPNAAVVLRNQGTAIEQKETSRDDGSFRFALVPPGSYALTVTAVGFSDEIINKIVVDPSQTVPLTVRMRLATSQTTVEINADAAIVQTANADIALTVNTRTIQDTALLTRNVFDLAFLAPAVTQGMNLNPAAGGARESGTAYLLNGSDNNDNFSEGAVNVGPPLESVGEFSILTNSFGAQYGRAGGAIVSAAQKSGTNQFHGVVYEFNRNREFNANTFFFNQSGAPNPKYNRNQFGGEVDGPVIRNRTFFSFAYDQVALKTVDTTIHSVQVPTSAELNAMKTGAGPLATQILSLYQPVTSETACPNEPDAAIGHIGCINVNSPIDSPQHNYFGRIDHNINDKNRLSAVVNFTRNTTTDAYGGGSAATTTAYPSTDVENYHNLALIDTHVFSAALVNEATLTHNRHYSNFFEGKNGLFTTPQVIIDGANFGNFGFALGPNSESEIEAFTQDRWQIQDNLSWTLGKHAIKFGGGWQYGNVYRNWDLGGSGQYEFGNTTGVTLAQAAANGDAVVDGSTINSISDSTVSNFQNDFPYFQETSVDPRTGAKADAYRHYVYSDANLFVQDDFKFSRRLTLNLGLRWERFGAPSEINGKLAQALILSCYSPDCIAAARVGPKSQMWNTNNKDFAPRIGFAWDVFGNGKTAFRGSYGISYDRIFDNIWSNAAWNPPFFALVDFDASGSDTINYSVPNSLGGSYVPNSLPGPAGRVSVRLMDVHLRDSYAQNFFAGVEHQLGKDFLIRVTYQGSLGRHLPALEYLNRYDGLRYNPTLAASPQPNALYTGMNYRANRISSDYNSGTVEVQKRFSQGLQFQSSYTWSKLMDFGSDLFSGETTQGQFSQPYYYQTNTNLALERGPGGFDHTHNFKVNLTYELPFFRSQQSLVGHILGGWQISAFYQGYSGHPIEVFSSRARFRGNAKDPNGFLENIGGDYNLDGVGVDHPNFVGSSVSSAYSGASPADGIFKDNNPIGCGYAGAQSTNIAACNDNFGVSTPNSLFVNPPGYGPHFGTLGRNVFRGPWFNGIDGALFKNIRFTETMKLQLRFEALNLINHPNFDGVDTNLNSGTFGKAQLLVGSSPARRLQLGARFSF